MPVFNVTFFVGMLAGSLCCMIDTIGDFHATAKVCCQAPPPAHVINRAMLIQGVSNLTAGLIGSGTGQTDFCKTVCKLNGVCDHIIFSIAAQTVGITSMTKVS